jgi:hypothetical protein
MAKKNCLSRLDQRRLEDFILENRSRIESGELTKDDVARIATKALEIIVTVGNVAGAAKGIEVMFGAAQGKRRGSSQALAARVRLLERVVARILGELGSTVPPELAELVARHKEEDNHA